MGKKYTYFVSYVVENRFGRCEVTRRQKIKSFDDIEGIEAAIAKSKGFDKVLISNFHLLNEKPN